MTWIGWRLPSTRSTTLGTADVPTVSSSGRGDQFHQVAQSAELPEARAGRPSSAAVERRGCGNPRDGKKVKAWNYQGYHHGACCSHAWERPDTLINSLRSSWIKYEAYCGGSWVSHTAVCRWENVPVIHETARRVAPHGRANLSVTLLTTITCINYPTIS